jgi:hypothetical protein
MRKRTNLPPEFPVPEVDACALCGRIPAVPGCLERHHIVPAAKGGKDTIVVCTDCGDQIHEVFTNNELRDVANTVETLRADPRMARWIAWVRKRPAFGVCMKRKKRRA